MCGVVLAGGVYLMRTPHAQVIPQGSYKTKEVVLGNTRYVLDIADTAPLREQGLSYRTSLAPQTGMLFVFNSPGVLKFWMKDMNFPLDIIWLDADKKIVHIEYGLSPSTYPRSFGPEIPTQYVIELRSGDVERNGVRIGDKINFDL